MQRLTTWFLVMAFSSSAAHAAQNLDGSLDASFGSGGHKLVDVSSTAVDKGKVLRIQQDGKLLMAGTCGTASLIYFCATRLAPNGASDLGFGANGTGSMTFDRFFAQGFPTSETLSDMLSLSDGRILFLGLGTLAMLSADGSVLDTGSGGGSGFVYPANFGNNALLEQADHKILVVGYASRNDGSGNYDMNVQRFLPDLSIDTAFGTGGNQSVVFNLGFSSSVATSVAVQTNGNIVLAGFVSFNGQAGKSVGIARLLPDGQLDPAFGGGAPIYQTYNPENVAFAVRIDPQGRIVYAGYSATDTNFSTRRCLINRLLANGSQDFSFNANQPLMFTVPVSSNNVPCEMVDLAVLGNGAVLAVGSLIDVYYTAVKVTPAGTFDPTFGVGGIYYGGFDAAATNSIVRSGAMAIGSGVTIAGANLGSDTQFGITQLRLRIFANGFE